MDGCGVVRGTEEGVLTLRWSRRHNSLLDHLMEYFFLLRYFVFY